MGHLDPSHLFTGPLFLLSCQSFASSRPQSWSRPRPCHPCHSPRWPLQHLSHRPREPHQWTSSSSRASGTCSSRSNTCWPSDRYRACSSSSLPPARPEMGVLQRSRAFLLPFLVLRLVHGAHSLVSVFASSPRDSK